MNKRFLIGAVVVVTLIGLLAAYQAFSDRQPKLEASSVVPTTTTAVKIGQKTYFVEVAATFEEQQQGLANRDQLRRDSGMLFPFKPAERVSFWMKDMKFALDLVWISGGKVIGVEKNVPVPATGTAPADLPTYQPPSAVDYVLELNAGESANFAVGDEVVITELQSI